MRLGATLSHLADAPPFPAAAWAAQLVEAGFDSLWAPEIIGRGALVPDPFVLLAAAAAVTGGHDGHVELGTATVQLPLHHPAEVAHRVRSLTSVCGDRLTLGVSPGSTAADFALLERDHTTRFATSRQHAARLRELLPDAPPRPQLLLGSWGRNVESAATEFDGWLASGVRRTPEQIVEAHARFRAAGGRRAVVIGVPVGSEDDLPSTREVLRRYADAGFDDAVVLFTPAPPHGPAPASSVDPARVRALLP